MSLYYLTLWVGLVALVYWLFEHRERRGIEAKLWQTRQHWNPLRRVSPLDARRLSVNLDQLRSHAYSGMRARPVGPRDRNRTAQARRALARLGFFRHAGGCLGSHSDPEPGQPIPASSR